MTQEDKELLLKDLSARLPYGVIVDYSYNAFNVHKGNYVKQCSKCILNCYLLDVFMSPRQNEKGEYIKPYLRPMSSIADLISAKEFSNLSGIKFIDWCNDNHIDYRGLIEKGLAIEVTEENNPYR